MIQALFHYQYLVHALLAAVFSSIACGIVGVIIVERRMIMMSGGIAHTAYGGVGLAHLTGLNPLLGALFFSVGAGIGIAHINRKGQSRSDVATGLFWSLGMALGILFIALTPGYPPDISAYLFGNILSVTRFDLILTVLVVLLVVLVMGLFFNHWKVFFFDVDHARLAGLPVAAMEYVIHVLVALTIVVLIRSVGIVLVLALLTAPATVAGMLARRLQTRMLLAVLIGLFASLSGLWISYATNIPSGALIVVICTLLVLAVWCWKRVSERFRGGEPLE